MTHDAEILIAGGGLVGAAMALALGDAGFAVNVLEREAEGAARAAGYDGRVSAISAASVRVFRHLDIWDELAPNAGPIRQIRVADGDSQAKVHFDAAETGEEPFGYMVENMTLRRVLAERMAGHAKLTVCHQAMITLVDTGGSQARVGLEGGETLSAPLLLVADGRRSSLRAMLGIPARQIDYAQTAMVCTIRHAIPHQEIALELFLPQGPLAVLPMTENRACIVWTESTAGAPYYLNLSDADFAAELHRAMRGYLGEIELLGKRHSYPLSLVQAKDYVVPRAALIGDSAHGIHPIAGQGVNLGYRDVAALTDILKEARGIGLDHGSASVLARYERWRRFDATAMMGVTDGLNRLFSTEMLPVRVARRLGMRLFDRSGPLKQFFMKNAMGLTGDLPTMLREAA